MTDAEKLRDMASEIDGGYFISAQELRLMADRLESLQAENERLKEERQKAWEVSDEWHNKYQFLQSKLDRVREYCQPFVDYMEHGLKQSLTY